MTEHSGNDSESQEDHSSRKRWLIIALQIGCWIVLFIPVLIYFLNDSFQAEMNEAVQLLLARDTDGLVQWAQKYQSIAFLATGLLMIVQAIAAPIPAVLITAANSVIYGPFLGGVWSIFSATIAASVCFFMARSLGLPVVQKFLPEKFQQQVDSLSEEYGTRAILIARLMPFVPYDPISFVAGLSTIRFWQFFSATLIGQIPAGMAYSYLVHHADSSLTFIVMVITTMMALVLIGSIFRAVLKKPTSN